MKLRLSKTSKQCHVPGHQKVHRFVVQHKTTSINHPVNTEENKILKNELFDSILKNIYNNANLATEQEDHINLVEFVSDPGVLAVVRLYVRLQSKEVLSEKEMDALGDIYEMSCKNDALDFVINEVDHILLHLIDDETQENDEGLSNLILSKIGVYTQDNIPDFHQFIKKHPFLMSNF